MKKVLLTLPAALVASSKPCRRRAVDGTPFKVRADIDNRMEFCAYTERYVQMRGRDSGRSRRVPLREGLHNSDVCVRSRRSSSRAKAIGT